MVILQHSINKRQGGAKNTGFDIARGKYIAFIDQDDIYLPEALHQIIEQIDSDPSLDMVMFDYAFRREGIYSPNLYQKNSVEVCDGLTYLKTNEISWMPWSYIYRREFLLENSIRFMENVQFGDVPVIRCITLAKKMRFNPTAIISYAVNPDSQSNITNETFEKLDSLCLCARQNLELYAEVLPKDKDAALIVKGHYKIMYEHDSHRLIHLNFSDKIKIIRKHYAGRFCCEDGLWLWTFSFFPLSVAIVLHIFSPCLRLMLSVKRKIRSRNK